MTTMAESCSCAAERRATTCRCRSSSRKASGRVASSPRCTRRPPIGSNRRACAVERAAEDAIGSTWQYRRSSRRSTTIRVVGGPDGRASYRQDRSNETVPASGCIIAHPTLERVIEAIRITPELDVSLRVSEATGQITARWDKRKGEVHGLARSVYSGANAFLVERVAGHDLRVSAGSFFQSGPGAAELLVDAVGRAAPELATAHTVLDAYAGVGLFAVASAPTTAKVITVETSRAAVEDCKVNLDGRDARIEQSEVSTWRPGNGVSIDVAIADPARSGLGRPGTSAMVAADPDVLVLVSCDPVALARDADLLGKQGYRHDGTEVLDLFPHTHHVECVTRFVRA